MVKSIATKRCGNNIQNNKKSISKIKNNESEYSDVCIYDLPKISRCSLRFFTFSSFVLACAT